MILILGDLLTAGETYFVEDTDHENTYVSCLNLKQRYDDSLLCDHSTHQETTYVSNRVLILNKDTMVLLFGDLLTAGRTYLVDLERVLKTRIAEQMTTNSGHHSSALSPYLFRRIQADGTTYSTSTTAGFTGERGLLFQFGGSFFLLRFRRYR